MNLLRNTALMLFTIISSNLFAHALWIECKGTGKLGVAQEVKIYYGEYASKELEPIEKWYSDVASFTLWLTTPQGQRLQLKCSPGQNFFTSFFTPSTNGTYVLTIVHEAKELGGTTKYEFSSNAAVSVGKLASNIVVANDLHITRNELKMPTHNKTTKLQAKLSNKPFANQDVQVFSPQGWLRTYKTDANGEVAILPLWPGRYVVEINHTDKTPGEHHGKPFKATWHGATTSFEVK